MSPEEDAAMCALVEVAEEAGVAHHVAAVGVWMGGGPKPSREDFVQTSDLAMRQIAAMVKTDHDLLGRDWSWSLFEALVSFLSLWAESTPSMEVA